jgi:glycosyltransferase involved in cell wall biosynthesis
MIIVIGPFPQPIHGASLITQRVAELLESEGHRVLQCNTSPREKARGIGHHLDRLRAYVRCIGVLLAQRRNDTVYLSLSGGAGLVYDLIVTAAARCCGQFIVFHHHSFAYLVNKSRLLQAIVSLAGRKQLHITLCPTMTARLTQQYGAGLPLCTVSNVAFFDLRLPLAKTPRQTLSVVGYLSNISFDKGIDRFLDFIAEMRRRGSHIRGRIAGPFVDDRVRFYVEKRIIEIGGIDYVGALYGVEKASFLSSLDLFLFPSRYLNEAQPMVIYESQIIGVPVVTTDRGCTRDMVGSPSGMLLDPIAGDLSALIERALIWERDPEAFRFVTSAAIVKREGLVHVGEGDRKRFLSIFDSVGKQDQTGTTVSS